MEPNCLSGVEVESWRRQEMSDDLLERSDPAMLLFWLPRFEAEVWHSDGKPYLPKTIHQQLCGLLRYMRSVDPACPNILDRKDPRFCDLNGACEVVFRKLHQSGVGTDVKHAAAVTFDEEEKLGSSGVLNVSDPKGLQQAVFYYVGKVYCIRGGEEQTALKPSQFVRSREPDCYTYIEHGSKN